MKQNSNNVCDCGIQLDLISVYVLVNCFSLFLPEI